MSQKKSHSQKHHGDRKHEGGQKKNTPHRREGHKSESYDLCINGAGPVGSTLACLLAGQGMKILLIERQALVTEPNPALDGRAYALAEGIRPLLKKAGIWQNLPRSAQEIAHIQVVDAFRLPGRTRKTSLLDFNRDDAPDNLPFGWMVEASDLLAACGRSLQEHSNITVLSQAEGQFSFSDTGVSVLVTPNVTEPGSKNRSSIKDHVQGHAALAIAADGRRSALRSQANLPLTRIDYHKSALVAILAHEAPHEGRALEFFLPQGPFARLPLPPTTEHPYRSAVVMTAAHSHIDRMTALPEQDFGDYITRLLASAHPKEQELGKMTCIGKRWSYPLASQYTHHYTAQRLAMIGDAAHGLHPVAGQGMNVGFRDVRCLADILGTAFHNGHDLGSRALLMRYQHETRPYNMAMLAGCDMMERLFSNNNPALARLRRLGLHVLERSPHLRQRFARHAMGL